MNCKYIDRREFFRAGGRTLAVGILGAVFVKLSFNKDDNRSDNKYPCLKVKSCQECELSGSCALLKAKLEKGL